MQLESEDGLILKLCQNKKRIFNYHKNSAEQMVAFLAFEVLKYVLCAFLNYKF